MSKPPNKHRPVTGFRLDPETLALFQTRLRQRGMLMQPTLEAWVKRWVETGEPFPEKIIGELREGRDELRTLLRALSANEGEHPSGGGEPRS
jgi:hypothetical protein